MRSRTKKIPVVKHLEDIDDLTIGRDTGICQGQKHLARKLADEIYKYSLENEYKKLIFTISSKKRAMETAELVKDILLKKKSQIKIIFTIDENLREIDQEYFVLPNNYEAGDYFNGLKIAGKIFSEETFSEEDNLTYQFGDFSTKDAKNKYLELKQYFRSYGESYKDVLLRFYNQVMKFSESIRDFDEKGVGVVIFTHGQPHQIFTDLSLVANKIKNNGYILRKGDLPRTYWNLYKARKKGVIPFGETAYVSVKNIYDSNMIKILE
jgi:broad specificity phosphatase PhoE